MRMLVSPKLSNFASFPRVSVLRTLTFYLLFQFGEQWCNEIGQQIASWKNILLGCLILFMYWIGTLSSGCSKSSIIYEVPYFCCFLCFPFLDVSIPSLLLSFCKICQVFALKIYLLCCTARQPISSWLLSKWVKSFRCSFISTNPIYGGLTEWESNIFTMLRLLLMCKVMESRIHGVTILDFAKLRVI